jgi:hypothetical protein
MHFLYKVLRNTWQERIKVHRLAIILSLIVGALSVAPHFLAAGALGPDYRGMPYLPLDNEDEYISQIQEIIDGHWLTGSPFYFEYKSLPPFMLPYGAFIYAIPSLIFHIDAMSVVILYKFLLPTVLFLLVYGFMLLITDKSVSHQKLTANAAGAFFAFCYEIVSLNNVVSFIRTGTAAVEVSLWTRPINPIVGALALLAFLFALWSVIKSKRYLASIICGFIVGFMTFYFFAWALALSILLFLLIIYSIKRSWDIVNRFAVTIVVAFIASTPFFLSGFLVNRLGLSSERIGLFYTHVPLLNKTVIAVIAIFVFLTLLGKWRQRDQEIITHDWWILSFSVLLGSLWVYIQQIFTGITIWPHRFVQYTEMFSSVALFIAGNMIIAKLWPRLWRYLMISTIVLSFTNGVIMTSGYQSTLEYYRDVQRYVYFFKWLNENAPKDCVVLVGEVNHKLTGLITAFTHCNVYFNDALLFAGVPQERIMHDFYTRLRMEGVSATSVKPFLESNPGLIRQYFWENVAQNLKSGGDAWVDKQIDRVENEYPTILAGNLADDIKKYRADYLVTERDLSKDTLTYWGVGQEVGNFNGLRLYSF